MTLKKALLRGLLGAPLGVFISYTITILISLFYVDEGIYSPVVPTLTQVCKNEIYAVLLQYLLSALLGFAFSAGSAVFEVEEWSITKQTVIHAILTITALFPIAYFCYWMEHTTAGFLFYFLFFAVFYVIIGAIKISYWKKRINTINKEIQGRR